MLNTLPAWGKLRIALQDAQSGLSNAQREGPLAQFRLSGIAQIPILCIELTV
jgi:hypothetical protein